MSYPPLFAASVPVLLRYLRGLQATLQAVEKLPDADVVLQARLAPAMIPFAGQVATAAQFALRTAFPLAGQPVPVFEPAPPDFAALHRRVADASSLLLTLDPESFEDIGFRQISEQAGLTPVQLPPAQFLAEFALPNFFFHLNMAYAIARAHGATLGKADYDGFHVYR